MFVGADSPHLSEGTLILAIEKLKESSFVIGPAADGGYYLLAARREIPEEVWTSVSYSQSDTGSEFSKRLDSLGAISFLPSDYDVDTYKELSDLRNDLRNDLQDDSNDLQPHCTVKNQLLGFLNQLS